MLEHSELPVYRIEKPRPKPKIDHYLEPIAQIIEEDKALPNQALFACPLFFKNLITNRGEALGYTGGL